MFQEHKGAKYVTQANYEMYKNRKKASVLHMGYIMQH